MALLGKLLDILSGEGNRYDKKMYWHSTKSIFIGTILSIFFQWGLELNAREAIEGGRMNFGFKVRVASVYADIRSRES